MPFNVLLHPRAVEELARIGTPLRRRITGKLKELEIEPAKRGKRLVHSGFWSLRIGDYRAIYEIHRDEERVIVLFIGHRRNVYDDFSVLF